MQQTFDTDIRRIFICKKHRANACLMHGDIGNPAQADVLLSVWMSSSIPVDGCFAVGIADDGAKSI